MRALFVFISAVTFRRVMENSTGSRINCQSNYYKKNIKIQTFLSRRRNWFDETPLKVKKLHRLTFIHFEIEFTILSDEPNILVLSKVTNRNNKYRLSKGNSCRITPRNHLCLSQHNKKEPARTELFWLTFTVCEVKIRAKNQPIDTRFF